MSTVADMAVALISQFIWEINSDEVTNTFNNNQPE